MAKRKTKKKTTRAAAGRKKATTRKKSTARKTTARKKTTSRAAAKKPARITAADKPRTVSEIYRTIAESTELTRQQVVAVFETMEGIINADLGKRGPGIVKLPPGLMKVTVQHKPRVPARKGINPFTGEETTFKAKPARNVVKVRPLKKLKDMV